MCKCFLSHSSFFPHTTGRQRERDQESVLFPTYNGCTVKCTRNIRTYQKSLEMGMGTPRGDLSPDKTLHRLRIPPQKVVNVNCSSLTKAKLGLLKTMLIQANTTPGGLGENPRKNSSEETSISCS